MRRFNRPDDFHDLDAELREHRREPRSAFLDELVRRVESVPVRVPARRPRFAAALVFAVIVVVGLAASGGVGYATSSVKAAAKSSSHAVSSVVTKGNNNNDNNNKNSNNNNSNNSNNSNNNNHSGGNNNPPWQHQYSRFVLVCYPFTTREKRGHVWVYVTKRHTIVVPRSLQSHFVPPGSLGSCGHN